MNWSFKDVEVALENLCWEEILQWRFLTVLGKSFCLLRDFSPCFSFPGLLMLIFLEWKKRFYQVSSFNSSLEQSKDGMQSRRASAGVVLLQELVQSCVILQGYPGPASCIWNLLHWEWAACRSFRKLDQSHLCQTLPHLLPTHHPGSLPGPAHLSQLAAHIDWICSVL